MSLPQELFDMIINEASRFPNKVERTRALIALALVSRAFRERAHDHLFASVAFNMQNDNMDAIKRFLSLLEADPNSETIGVASRITSFECCIPLHATTTDPLVRVLKKLFVGNGRPASLSLQFISSRRWSSLAEDLAQELFQVCHRPRRLASLSIYHLHDIPRNFLRNTSIKRLFLADVSVSDTQLPESLFAGMDDQGHSETGTLEFLHISVEKPILALLTSPQQSGNSSAVFSHLKELRFFPPSREFDPGRNFDKILVGCKDRLEFLKISFGIEADPLTSLPLPRLPNLHTFAVTALTPSETSLSSLAMFLNQTEGLPNLHTIELRVRISPRVLSLDDEEILPALDGVGCKVLDNIFAQKKFNHVRKLTLRILSYHVSQSRYPVLRTPGKCRTLILSRFPHIATREHLTFLVDVKIF